MFLSACVYLTIPSSCEKKQETPATEEEQLATVEADYDALIEAYFANRPVRDVPQNADFSSFLVANYAKNQRDFKTAAGKYAKVLKSDSDNLEIKEKLYLYFVLAGQVDKAIAYAYQALEVDKGDLLASMVVLSSLAKQGDYQGAQDMLKLANGGYQALLKPLLSAWIYAGLNDDKKALASLDSLKDASELKAAYLLHRALLFDYFSNTESAAQEYGLLMKSQESKNVRVLLLLKDFESRTHALTDKKTFALQYAALQEESFISKEMMSSPGDGERVRTPIQGMSWVFFDLASALGQARGSDLDLSLFFANLALYLNPNSSITQLFMGEILEELNLLEQANAFYSTVKPTQNIYLSVQMRTVINQIKMENYDAAIRNLNHLIALYPKAALFHLTLGDAYRQSGDCERALPAYRQTEKLADTFSVQAAPIFFYQGVCLESMGKKAQASEYFEKALALDGQNPIYLNYAGYLWLEQNKNIPQALELIQRAVNKAPNDGSILDSLGWAYYLMGEYEKALPILERAVMLQAGNAVLNSHLGDVYWKLGRYREARFQWSHAAGLTEGLTAELETQLADKIKVGLPQ